MEINASESGSTWSMSVELVKVMVLTCLKVQNIVSTWSLVEGQGEVERSSVNVSIGFHMRGIIRLPYAFKMRQDYLSTSYLDQKYLPSERSETREI